jgi:DNA-binding response OmpR family regulator
MMGEKPAVNLILVEDETVYSKMILFQLSKLDFTEHTLSINHVSSLTELKEIKDFLSPDIILLDLGLPETSGTDTFLEAKSIFPESAIIILSGTDDDVLARNIVKKGAQDYLVKSDADSKVLRKTIEYALDRFQFQHALSNSNQFDNGFVKVLSEKIELLKVLINDQSVQNPVNSDKMMELANEMQELLIRIKEN